MVAMLTSAAPAAFLHPVAQMCRLAHSLPPVQPCASHLQLPRAAHSSRETGWAAAPSSSAKACCRREPGKLACPTETPPPGTSSTPSYLARCYNLSWHQSRLNPSQTCTLTFQAGGGFAGFSATDSKESYPQCLLTGHSA